METCISCGQEIPEKLNKSAFVIENGTKIYLKKGEFDKKVKKNKEKNKEKENKLKSK